MFKTKKSTEIILSCHFNASKRTNDTKLLNVGNYTFV